MTKSIDQYFPACRFSYTWAIEIIYELRAYLVYYDMPDLYQNIHMKKDENNN